MAATPQDEWAQRRETEFRRCLTSFSGQFREWKERTETPIWANHYSQVRAIEALLIGVSKKASEMADQSKGDDDYTSALPEFQKVVLSGWRVWEFFRAKLAQRQEEQFQPGLRAADELAWACRKPLADAAPGAPPKEPALVYLNGNASPIALARGRNFWGEGEPGLGQLDAYCAKLLEHVPVPLISLPWHEIWHAPSLTAVTHEAGHVVEADFALTADLDAALKQAMKDAATPALEKDWVGTPGSPGWRAEVFADFFAVRQCGPGYVGMLGDVLATATTDRKLYPPNDVRMELCFLGLEEMGLADEAKKRREAWNAIAPSAAPSPAMASAAAVVKISQARNLQTLAGRRSAS